MLFSRSFWCKKQQMNSKGAEQEIHLHLLYQLTAKTTNSPESTLSRDERTLSTYLNKCDLTESWKKLDLTVEADCLWHKEMKRERFKPPQPDDPLCCCGDIDQQREYCCCDCEELDDACERSEVNHLTIHGMQIKFVIAFAHVSFLKSSSHRNYSRNSFCPHLLTFTLFQMLISSVEHTRRSFNKSL